MAEVFIVDYVCVSVLGVQIHRKRRLISISGLFYTSVHIAWRFLANNRLLQDVVDWLAYTAVVYVCCEKFVFLLNDVCMNTGGEYVYRK